MKLVIQVVFGFLITISFSASSADINVQNVSLGSTPLYTHADGRYQDLSGSAVGHLGTIFAFDGGKNSANPSVRLINKTLRDPAIELPRQVVQNDIEGATYHNERYILLSSLSQQNEDTQSYRLVSAIKLEQGSLVIGEQFRDIRQDVLERLKELDQHGAWYRRMVVSFGKSGGLNAEAISTYKNKKLMIGLRSPLYDEHFGSSQLNDDLSLDVGQALILATEDIFADTPQYDVYQLDLHGNGIRGMEYIEELDLFIIISGPTIKGDGYGLWSYKLGQQPKLLKLSELEQLCRPESILVSEDKDEFYVLSEQSGKACQHAKHNFIKVKYNH